MYRHKMPPNSLVVSDLFFIYVLIISIKYILLYWSPYGTEEGTNDDIIYLTDNSGTF